MGEEILDFVLDYLGNMHIPARRIVPPFCTLRDYDLGLRASILKMDVGREVGTEAGLLEPETIFYLTDRFQLSFAVMALPQKDEYLLVGPMLETEMEEEKIYEVMERNRIPKDFYSQMYDYYRERVCHIKGNGIYALINQLGQSLYGKDRLNIRFLNAEQMEVWEDYFNSYELQIPESPVLGMKVLEQRYAYENDLLEAVSKGSAAQAMGIIADSFSHMTKRVQDELRDRKNLLITLNTLLRKAVEGACVHPWHIDRFSNSNVVKIEQIETMEQVEEMYPGLVRGYCEMVQKHSLLGYSLLTRRIINTIDADITQDLSLKSFAAQLNVNASYLSGLFKSDVGVALTDYVNHRRMHEARKLLRSTSLAVQDVALRVGVADVHYFNRLFRRDTGMAPREYRERQKGGKE